MGVKELTAAAEEKMKKSVAKLKSDFAAVHTGRASPVLLEPVKVEYYDSVVPIAQVATVAIPEPRVIEIRPWDKAVLPAIEKAILKANIGVTPQNDGKVIRLVMPQMTQERRQEIVKVVRRIAEEFRISLRNERRDAVDLCRKAEKAKEITEDDVFNAEKDLQKMVDVFIKQVDAFLVEKEKEIMEV